MVSDGVIESYAIAGAVAAIFYTEPTDTADLDVMVAFPKTSLLITLEPIYDYLKGLGYDTFEKEGVIIEGGTVHASSRTRAFDGHHA